MKLAKCKLTFRKIGRIALCFLLICALCVSFLHAPAHAEAIAITVAIMAGIVVAIAGTVGLVLTYNETHTTTGSIKGFVEWVVADYFQRHPDQLIGATVIWATNSWLLSEQTVKLSNAITEELKNKYGIAEGVDTPKTICYGEYNGFYLSKSTPNVQRVFSDWDAFYNAFPETNLYSIPDNSAEYGWYLLTSGTNRTAYLTEIPSISWPIYAIPQAYQMFAYNPSNNTVRTNVITYSPSSSSSKVSTSGAYSIQNPIGLNLSEIYGAIPDEYIPAEESDDPTLGSSITYEGAPTSEQEWLEGVYAGSLAGTLEPERQDLIPYAPPVPPIPGEWTTWEDGALEFFSSLGGTISETLGQAGTGVRNWIQTQIGSIKGVLDNILSWCTEFADTFVHAEDTWIGGIVDSFETVFSGAIARIRTALGLWHYVVDWVLAVTAPFNFFLDAAGRVSYHLLLPVYASLAGLVILGIYKRFIG